MTKMYYRLVDAVGKVISDYDHPVRAESAADYYFKTTGYMPKIIKIKPSVYRG